MESELSQDWEYDAYFPIYLVTVAVTVIVAGLIYLAVRYFPVKKKLQKLIPMCWELRCPAGCFFVLALVSGRQRLP